MALTILAFVAAGSLVLLVFVLFSGRNARVDERIRALSGVVSGDQDNKTVAQLAHSTLPKIGELAMPRGEKELGRAKMRLIHAGLYHPAALGLFLGVKVLFIVVPVLLGELAGSLGMWEHSRALLYGLVGSTVGMLLPGMFLDYRKRQRQTQLRRSLPDALDVITICLEGGLSLQAALQQVVKELEAVHPLLATEMLILQRTTQMSRTTGEALREFADRCDLDEVRGLASVVQQAERLGASIVKTLRTHSEQMRAQRLLRAEELAHKAATKMVFPTILCIFPAILLVLAGPAAFQVVELIAEMGKK